MSPLLTLLGWNHAKVGVNATDFASAFNARGFSAMDNLNKVVFICATKRGAFNVSVGCLKLSKGVVS